MRHSDQGTVEARDQRTPAERAHERPTEESALAQVGPDGWLPWMQQPRDAQQPLRRRLCKKGGTAGSDVSRPFGPVRQLCRVDWRLRLVAGQNQREYIAMQDQIITSIDETTLSHITP